ncbi:unnamed protein product [Peniophora sp. CBMAI 1063]|nr:unnamed protein product [Peniophora sp. CBMAI 1063]
MLSFDSALASSSKQAAMYEGQIKTLEDKLSEDLSNCRAIDGLLREAFVAIKRSSERAKNGALQTHVPYIHRELDESLAVLDDLERRLPLIRDQVAQVRRVYDSGRVKAKQLVHDLEWLNMDWHERWRIIVFTPRAPVSWRWKTLYRVLFTMFMATTIYLLARGLQGLYRAHSYRFVWGERLMS